MYFLCCFLSLTAFSFDFSEAFLYIVECATKFCCFLPQDIPLLPWILLCGIRIRIRWHRGVKIAPPPSAATSPEASSPAKVTPSRPGAGVCVSWNTVTGTIAGSSTSHGTKARRSCSVSARHLPFPKGTGHALEHAMKPIGFRSETSTTVIGTFATKELFVE